MTTQSLSASEPNLGVLSPELRPFVTKALEGLEELPEDRVEVLTGAVKLAVERVKVGKPVKMAFICTHNSRRSHLSHVWATVAADVFSIPGVEAHSAGTEATACNIRTVKALQRAGWGMDIAANGESSNPHYRMTYGANGESVMCWSKTLSDDTIPTEDLVAMMCCSSADKGCPFVPGSVGRVSLHYEDPKVADGTPEEEARYDERSLQIVTEMLWMMREVGRESSP